MKPAPVLALCLIVALSACSGVSTGVRSPCFAPGSGNVTRSPGFATSIAPEASAERGPAHDCDFRDL